MRRGSAKDALERIRLIKEGKVRPIDSYEVRDESQIEEVDEDEYERLKKSRKGFIDHGREEEGDDDDEEENGYEDDGEELWNGDLGQREREEKKGKKPIRRDVQQIDKPVPHHQSINRFFSNIQTQQQSKKLAQSELEALKELEEGLQDSSSSSWGGFGDRRGKEKSRNQSSSSMAQMEHHEGVEDDNGGNVVDPNSFTAMFGGNRQWGRKRDDEDEEEKVESGLDSDLRRGGSGREGYDRVGMEKKGNAIVSKKRSGADRDGHDCSVEMLDDRNVKRLKREESVKGVKVQWKDEKKDDGRDNEKPTVSKGGMSEIVPKKERESLGHSMELKLREGSTEEVAGTEESKELNEVAIDVKGIEKQSIDIDVPMREEIGVDENPIDDVDDDKRRDITNGVIPPSAVMTIPNDDGHISALPFFLLDVYEEPRGRSLYLFGKIYPSLSDKSITESCCIVVDHVDRNLLILPTEQPKSLDEGIAPHEDGDWVQRGHQIMNELEPVFKALKIKQKMFTPVKRHYTFDTPGVPKKKDLMFVKVVYSSEHPIFPHSVTSKKGQHYSRIFGTDTSLTELLMIKRKIMGPSWMLIKDWENVSQYRVSSCVHEIKINNSKSVAVMRDTTEFPSSPPLTLLSLSLDFTIGASGNSELALASCCWAKNVDVSTLQWPQFQKSNRFIAVRRISGIPMWPRGWKEALNNEGAVTTETEIELLSQLVERLDRVDPDILVGHDLYGSDLEGLANRLKALRLTNWSKFSRLRRTTGGLQQLKRAFGGGVTTAYSVQRHLVVGRLICDTMIQSREYIRGRATFDLNSILIDRFPSEQFQSLPLPTSHSIDTFSDMYKSLQTLTTAIRDCIGEAIWSCRLMGDVKMLNLTRELSVLAGCLWQWSLMSRRADRNDFLLLHRFHDLKYLCPERQQQFGNKKKDEAEDEEGDDVETAVTSKKKAAYAGGLVLEPKSGLYDTFILLLDFNSLYPSLIQEFNICFTTTEVDKNGDATVTDLSTQGILPSVQKSLVERRRQVKDAMKRLGADQSGQRATLDIRQLALKLTANSMYGCLGFSHSRFCARPLAKLITQRGRELLEKTKNRVESEFRLNVIYGDTDSLMIDSGLNDEGQGVNYQQALQIAETMMKKLNSPKSQLELGLDGVFIRLLLLTKKKYACKKVIDYSKGIFQEENKGLDIVRRDWCRLVKIVGNEVLGILFDPSNSIDTVVEKLHDLLKQVNEKLENGEYPIDVFVITKGLNKMPDHYADARLQPHVTVAQRLQKMGRPIRPGIEIQYVMCIIDDNKDSPNRNADGDKKDEQSRPKSTIADKAFHLEEVEKQGMKIDVEWYKKNQLIPPIGRLCQHVSGTNLTRLAECLGIQAGHYETVGLIDGSNNTNFTNDDQDNDEEEEVKFPRSPFNDEGDLASFRCPHCRKEIPSINLITKLDSLECPSCHLRISFVIVRNWILRSTHQLLKDNGLYKSKCSDCPAGIETRRVSMLSHQRCLNGSCPNPKTALEPMSKSVSIHSLIDHLSSIVKCPTRLKHRSIEELREDCRKGLPQHKQLLLNDVKWLRLHNSCSRSMTGTFFDIFN